MHLRPGVCAASIAPVRGILACLAVAAVAGCSPERPSYQEVARCEVDAIRVYPTDDASNVSGRWAGYVETCMQANGWDFDTQGASCIPNLRPHQNPNCYKRAMY
jgi:hypothetical protein